MALRMFMTTVTSSRKIKSEQSDMMRILDTRGLPYETVDIAVEKSILEEMREKAGDSCVSPPQLFRGDKYIGGFEQLMVAVEDGKLDQFLEVKE